MKSKCLPLIIFCTVLSIPSSVYAGICWNIIDGQVGQTELISEPRSANPISLSNHRCRDIANGVWSQRFENQQITQVEFSAEASGAFKGADLGFSGTISQETTKTKIVELQLPPTLPKCTHWGRLFTDEFRVKVFRFHVRQFSLQYGTVDHYSGTLNHCSFRRSGTPASGTATVKKHIMISYVDRPEPTPCRDNDECRRCGTATGTDSSTNIEESEQDSDTNDPGNSRQLGFRLDELGPKAHSLGSSAALAVALPDGYAITTSPNTLMTIEGQISYDKGIYTWQREGGESQTIKFKPIVLKDGTVFSRKGLILLSNGGVLRFGNSVYAMEPQEGVRK